MNPDTEERLSPDRILELLADPCRRAILAQLNERAGSTTVTQLADSIAASDDDLDHRNDDDLVLTLRHVHLPKLAERGVIEYDSDSDTVRYESHESIEKLLRFVSDELSTPESR
ncbi:MAG: DNA-binding transcriptional ArsR family regulator [Haloarculaceae archaeon]|jgi:DNA-binding transcriptional ArsR family regulator